MGEQQLCDARIVAAQDLRVPFCELMRNLARIATGRSTRSRARTITGIGGYRSDEIKFIYIFIGNVHTR